MSEQEISDLLVIGGGINGCGIARDAVGRGYSVTLAEMDDFASGTSSRATKLIHGGLRYLEHYEFRLVREALMEREILWAMAPHIIRPLRFVLPFQKGGIRPAWLIRLGLFLYDHLGGRKLLPATRTLDLRKDPAGRALKPVFSTAFEYSDGWVDDARFVVLNARDAADRGAVILARHRVLSARRQDGVWHVELRDERTGDRTTRRARMLINAGGPWVDEVIGITGENGKRHVRLVQGSHIVIRRKFEGERAYFFQNPDNRIIFAIPYEGDFTLIGTTDRDYVGDPKNVAITQEETDYLCHAASEYFAEPVTPADVVWTYSGVRPLFDDGASKAQEATRDYVLKLDQPDGQPPLLNVFGGKLTTYRRLAEHAMEKIGEAIGIHGKPWTAKSRLPGGGFATNERQLEIDRLRASHPFLEEAFARRLVGHYGTEAKALLGAAAKLTDLGRHFGADLYEAELEYLAAREWARTAEDVLWRRTKLGLLLSAEEAGAVAEHMAIISARANG